MKGSLASNSLHSKLQLAMLAIVHSLKREDHGKYKNHEKQEIMENARSLKIFKRHEKSLKIGVSLRNCLKKGLKRPKKGQNRLFQAVLGPFQADYGQFQAKLGAYRLDLGWFRNICSEQQVNPVLILRFGPYVRIMIPQPLIFLFGAQEL